MGGATRGSEWLVELEGGGWGYKGQWQVDEAGRRWVGLQGAVAGWWSWKEVGGATRGSGRLMKLEGGGWGYKGQWQVGGAGRRWVGLQGGVAGW